MMTRITSRQRLFPAFAVVAFLLITSWMTAATTAGRYVSNLSTGCLRCLCHASTACNATIGCSRGYCGPYYLYREYWRDAGQVVLPDDDPDRDQAFVDCAVDPACAQKAVENYMAKYGRDCNNDGVTDCDDYARTHFNGKEDCSAIDRTNFWRRYETCRPSKNRGSFN
ncbi:lysozyme-like [Sipha flava]|uniref:lysozyme n=1 Tax=Sipha flava TaxID=143950 RepID=A0A2S2QVX7_9HEMI|nr:lysozyme-like [Sipha flava]